MAEAIDPYEFINKTYAESSIYELNDALGMLSASIDKTEDENRQLISSHFSKFVECRSTLESIFEDILKKNLDKELTDGINRKISLLTEKYRRISGKINADIQVEVFNNRKIYLQNEYSPVINLYNDLLRCTNTISTVLDSRDVEMSNGRGGDAVMSVTSDNTFHFNGCFEKFVDIYRRALKVYSPVKNSVFLTRKVDECRQLISMFLENIYEFICNEKLTFNDTLYYFDLYFEVNGNKTDRRIMNTLLVNFKESTFEEMCRVRKMLRRMGRSSVPNENSHNYSQGRPDGGNCAKYTDPEAVDIGDGNINLHDDLMTYLETSLTKFLDFVDDDIKRSGIDHYFDCIKYISKNTRLCKMLFKRCISLQKSTSLSQSIKVYFAEKFSEAKIDVFYELIQDREDDDLDTVEASSYLEDESTLTNEPFKEIGTNKTRIIKLSNGALKLSVKEDIEKDKFLVSQTTTSTIMLNSKIRDLVGIFESYKEILSDREIRKAQHILTEHLKEKIDSVYSASKESLSCRLDQNQSLEYYKCEELEFLQLDISPLKKCLGSKNSKCNKEIDKYLISKRSNVVVKLSEKLNKKITEEYELRHTESRSTSGNMSLNRGNNENGFLDGSEVSKHHEHDSPSNNEDVLQDTTTLSLDSAIRVKSNFLLKTTNYEVPVLMYITTLFNRTSRKDFEDIIFESTQTIVRYKVIYYFLKKYMKQDGPLLSEEEQHRVEDLKFQFEYFL